MRTALIVGIGGFLGSAVRYVLGGWVQRIAQSSMFPWGTLAVNLTGCFLIGFLGGLAEQRQMFSSDIRAFLFIGILGGFTTFSTFGYETVALLREGDFLAGTANALAQLMFGLAFVWAGHVVTRYL